MEDFNKKIEELLKKRLANLKSKIEKAPTEYLKTDDGEKTAQKIVDNLVARTRLGYAVKKFSGPRGKFEKLKKSTIKKRRKYEANLKTGFTKPGRSNLTATGQLLDSLKYRIENDKITLFFDGDHGKNIDGSDSKIKNSDLAKYMEAGDTTRNRPSRPFFNMSKTEVETIKKKIARDIRKLIRRK